MADRAGFDYDDDISEDKDAVRAALQDKTIASVAFPECSTDDGLELRFTDGSVLTLVSWDYEGYSSGIYAFPGKPAVSEGQE